MTAIDGPSAGVNLVQEHSRWDNVFQQLKGKVTLEVCAFSVCRVKEFELSAADVIEWGVKVASLMADQAKAANVPVGNAGGPQPEGYTPAQTGPMPRTLDLADQSDLGNEVPPYEYVEPPGPPPG